MADTTLSIVVVGASGNLSRKKTFPSLYHLCYQDFLPEHFTVVGYARSGMELDEFKELVSQNFSCRLEDREKCEQKMETMMENTFYATGQYNSVDDFQLLNERLCAREEGFAVVNRIFYLAIPPDIFVDVARCVGRTCKTSKGFNRVVIEKPFGRDLGTYETLCTDLHNAGFSEEEIYRIDHYLGKELVQNLFVMRFANSLFEPLWNRNSIHSVQITWKEDIGVEGRGGYFDRYGIIRDIMQNHLLNLVLLVAMEPPITDDSEDVRDEKVKVLRCMDELRREDLVLGQYKAHTHHGKVIEPAYVEDATVADDSLTETYAAAVLKIQSPRWQGVPFLVRCGKGLDERKTEIRIQFKRPAGKLFARLEHERNELIIRVQPSEGISLRIMSKVPGMKMRTRASELNMLYKNKFSEEIPDAYERLILDVIKGDKSLFLREDELEHAWKVFTPVLQQIEAEQKPPKLYPFGSRGPAAADHLAAKYNVVWSED